VLDLTAQERNYFENHFPLFAVCAKEHLRGQRIITPSFLSAEDREAIEKSAHQALWIILALREKLQVLRGKGVMDSLELSMLNQNLDRLVDSLGACERIKNTPIPFSYSVFLKKFIFFYVMLFPLVYCVHMSYYIIPVTVFILYVLGSIELIAEEIEDPFNGEANDLPTLEMAENIGRNVTSILT